MYPGLGGTTGAGNCSSYAEETTGYSFYHQGRNFKLYFKHFFFPLPQFFFTCPPPPPLRLLFHEISGHLRHEFFLTLQIIPPEVSFEKDVKTCLLMPFQIFNKYI